MAFICRYGQQDVHRVSGKRELSALDWMLFARAIQEHVTAERKPLPTENGE